MVCALLEKAGFSVGGMLTWFLQFHICFVRCLSACHHVEILVNLTNLCLPKELHQCYETPVLKMLGVWGIVFTLYNCQLLWLTSTHIYISLLLHILKKCLEIDTLQHENVVHFVLVHCILGKHRVIHFDCFLGHIDLCLIPSVTVVESSSCVSIVSAVENDTVMMSSVIVLKMISTVIVTLMIYSPTTWGIPSHSPSLKIYVIHVSFD